MTSYKPRLLLFSPWMLRIVLPSKLIGTYTLYKSDSSGITPIYVGRSDTDLLRRLVTHPYQGIGTHFQFNIHENSEQAFIVECSLFHMYEYGHTLLNKIHPAAPSHSTLRCPFCQTMAITLGQRIDLSKLA